MPQSVLHSRFIFLGSKPVRNKIFQVDAFTTRLFGGNPAAVMPLTAFLPDAHMQAIAAENNLSETAFIVAQQGDYALRWFTPLFEVPLCGHATLASAAVVLERLEPQRNQVVFHTASGALTVRRAGSGYAMDFPAREAQAIPALPQLTAALGTEPVALLRNDFNYLAVLQDEQAVRMVTPDMARLAALDLPGIIVSARGSGEYDCVSRYFAPAKGVPEDPVTGSAHCMLAPYWAGVLGKTALRAWQASKRGGEIACRLVGERVELAGSCVFYLEGETEL
jgi:PhzF family phenazine biosynthesis protein